MVIVRALAFLPLLLAAMAHGQDVEPGSPAPPLSVKKWIKGAPVPEIAAKGIYVVEFWATWCGPCIESIPHLTQIAKKNPDVTFVGVSIWEDDQGGNIKRFVDKMGSKMDYHVGWSGNQDGMAQTWMKAAYQNGIPTAFVVKDRKVLWIGHPMELEKPLAEIKAQTFDLEGFQKEFDDSLEEARKEMAVSKGLEDAEKLFATDRPGAKAALAKIAKENPDTADSVAAIRLGWLAKEDPKAWDVKARALARSGKSADMLMLLSFALRQTASPGTIPLARRAVSLALQAEPKGFDALNYASQIYRETKDYDKALDATKKMILYFPTGQVGGQPEFKAELLRRKAELLVLMKAPRT